ncbi:LUD domain-containing protein [Streptomyces sp. NPDC005046]
MNDLQAIADRVEIEALRGEFTDAAMMRDRPRLASLFTPDGALRMPSIPAELVGREEIRAGGERLQSQWDFFVQTTHPDINAGGRYQAIRPRVLAIDRATGAYEIRRLLASPEFAVNSVAAVTETGSLVLASGSGSQLPANAGGAAHAVWVVGAQKVVPDLSTALRRVEEHALPLENARAQAVYGMPSAVNRLLILNAEPRPGRGTVLLLREAIGY